MATTPLTIRSLRYGAATTISASVSSVALDAIVNEIFTMPAGFGDMLIEYVFADIDTLSGAYVAPAPAYDGLNFSIYDSNGALADSIGASRFVNYGTSSTRPYLASTVNPDFRMLIRQNERFHISAPIIAGAGVTATVFFLARGIRLKQA